MTVVDRSTRKRPLKPTKPPPDTATAAHATAYSPRPKFWLNITIPFTYSAALLPLVSTRPRRRPYWEFTRPCKATVTALFAVNSFPTHALMNYTTNLSTPSRARITGADSSLQPWLPSIDTRKEKYIPTASFVESASTPSGHATRTIGSPIQRMPQRPFPAQHVASHSKRRTHSSSTFTITIMIASRLSIVGSVTWISQTRLHWISISRLHRSIKEEACGVGGEEEEGGERIAIPETSRIRTVPGLGTTHLSLMKVPIPTCGVSGTGNVAGSLGLLVL